MSSPSRRLFASLLWEAPLGLAAAQAAERHPSLWYDRKDRERMRSRIAVEPWAGWWNELQTSTVRSAPAFLWWLAGNEEAAARCRQDLLDKPIFRQQPQGYLEPSSHHLSDFVAAYDLLASWQGLRAADHAAMRDKIAAEADYYYEVLESVRGGANYGNQRMLAASALGVAALALGESKWLNRALHEIGREENLCFFRPGGLFVEGTGYTNYMNVQLVPFAIAYERATGKDLLEEPRVRDALVFAAYQMLANGDIIPWGTCEVWRGLGFFGLLSNRRYGREHAALFHHAFTRAPRIHRLHQHIAIAHYDPAAAGPLPPASRIFAPSHFAVLRENWRHDYAAVWFGAKEKGWPALGRVDLYRSYSQGDCGHFVIAMGDEVLAADSGYDHWKSKDYFGPQFHNVLLIDGNGPDAYTTGEMSGFASEGLARHASVTTRYGGCTLRRKIALVRGRYIIVVDRISAAAEHEYVWQVRSTCPPGAEGSRMAVREIVWPGLAPDGWQELRPGRMQLTTVVPPFARLTVTKGRWRPISARPEFINQVALASWRAAGVTALFVLIPNARMNPDVSWAPLDGQNIAISGPGWSDIITVEAAELRISGRNGIVLQRLVI